MAPVFSPGPHSGSISGWLVHFHFFSIIWDSVYIGWVKKVSHCTVIDISKSRQFSTNVKYSIILWTVQELKVSNTNSICVVKYSMLHTFMTPCLHKLLRVCLEVISLIAFSHRIFKQNNCDVKYFTWKYQTILHFLCSCSYLVIFLLSSQFYWQIRLKSTAYFFDPPCTVPYNMLRQWHEGQALCMLKFCHLFPKVLFWTGRGLGATG